MKNHRLFLLVFTCLLVRIPDASATTWYVNPDGTGDAPTIQAAIDFASAADTVLCSAGTYTGEGNRDLDFAGKRLVLISEDGPQVTVIDCQGSAGQPRRGLFFHSGEDSAATVEGFTITGASSETAGAITITGSIPTIRDCIITANQCNGIDCYPSFPSTGVIRIEDCEITYNTGHGVRAWGARTVIERSDISFNGMNGVSIDYSGELEISETLANNNGEIGLFIFTLAEHFSVTNCTFYGNRTGFFWDINFPKNSKAPDASAMSDSSTVANCVFAFNHEHGVLAYMTAPGQQIFCSNSFGNGVSDWEGSEFGAGDGYDNFSANPAFCDAAAGDFSIGGNSPCAPANNDCGVVIGAVGVGCIYTGITGGGPLALPFRLGQNYPNPFNPSTTFEYSIPSSGPVSLRVYDVAGRLVQTLLSEPKTPGEYKATWDGRDRNGSIVASGVYFARLEFGAQVETKRMLLLK